MGGLVVNEWVGVGEWPFYVTFLFFQDTGVPVHH